MRHAMSTHGRLSGLVILVSAAAVGLAACGGPSFPGIAGGNGTNGASTSTTIAAKGSNPSGETSQSEKLLFARCMRSHGISNYPDPSANGSQLLNILRAGIDTRSSAYRSALHACKKYTQAGHLTPAASAAENAKGLEFSQCMRLHGVPNFPEPSTGPNGQQVINLAPEHIDPNSPTVQAAGGPVRKLFRAPSDHP
jgi:hypothetical protein